MTGGVRWLLRAEGLAALAAAVTLYAATDRGWGFSAHAPGLLPVTCVWAGHVGFDHALG